MYDNSNKSDYEHNEQSHYIQQQYHQNIDPFAQSLGLAIGGLAGCFTSLVGGVVGGLINAVGSGLSNAHQRQQAAQLQMQQMSQYRLPYNGGGNVIDVRPMPRDHAPESKVIEPSKDEMIEQLQQQIAMLQSKLVEVSQAE